VDSPAVDPLKVIIWFQTHTPRWLYRLFSGYAFRPRRIMLTAAMLDLAGIGTGRPLRWASELWRAWAVYESNILVEDNIRVDLAVIIPVVFVLTGVATVLSVAFRR
jgi:hypothetical protein